MMFNEIGKKLSMLLRAQHNWWEQKKEIRNQGEANF